jgi:hypothetical protein
MVVQSKAGLFVVTLLAAGAMAMPVMAADSGQQIATNAVGMQQMLAKQNGATQVSVVTPSPATKSSAPHR